MAIKSQPLDGFSILTVEMKASDAYCSNPMRKHYGKLQNKYIFVDIFCESGNVHGKSMGAAQRKSQPAKISIGNSNKKTKKNSTFEIGTRVLSDGQFSKSTKKLCQNQPSFFTSEHFLMIPKNNSMPIYHTS